MSAGGGRLLPLCGSGGITPEIFFFLKTQMLSPAFWWLMRSSVDSEDVYIQAFLLFENYGQYIVGPPNLKVGGTSLPRSARLLCLWPRDVFCVTFHSLDVEM